jgi:uridylate kinase
MADSTQSPIVISVGGSLIVPNGGINTSFLQKLNECIRSHVSQGRRFFLVAGGGKLARTYRDAGKQVIGTLEEDDLDWLGIHATRLNAHLLRTIFQDIANPRIIDNYDKKFEDLHEPVVIGAGWKPGWSTDYDAVILARDYNAHLIVNLSNVDYVHTSDPRKDANAERFEKIAWSEFAKLVPEKWSPGINVPFDPVAAKLAHELGLTVVITHGENFENLNKILNGDSDYIGTTITP